MTARTYGCAAPQRRQNRALADSGSPQLAQAWLAVRLAAGGIGAMPGAAIEAGGGAMMPGRG